MSDTLLIDAARQWVIDKYPFGSRHLTESLVWLDRLAPGSREAVRIATLTHDMERAFPGPNPPLPAGLNDYAYYRAHSERSARIVSAWLCEQGAAEALVRDAEALVLVHEFGGWPEANLVQAADSLSFLETNIDLFLGFTRSGRYPPKDVGIKFQWMLDRIQIDEARTLGEPLLEQALARLADLGVEMAASGSDDRASRARERSGDRGAPASERVGGAGGAKPPGLERSGDRGAPASERVGGSGGAKPSGLER